MLKVVALLLLSFSDSRVIFAATPCPIVRATQRLLELRKETGKLFAPGFRLSREEQLALLIQYRQNQKELEKNFALRTHDLPDTFRETLREEAFAIQDQQTAIGNLYVFSFARLVFANELKRIWRQKIGRNDALQAAAIGILESLEKRLDVNKVDPNKNSIKAYLFQTIETSLSLAAAVASGLPEYKFGEVASLSGLEGWLAVENDRPARDEEILRALGRDPDSKKDRSYLEALRRARDIARQDNQAGFDKTRADYNQPIHEVMGSEFKAYVNQILQKMRPRERKIIKMYYGFDEYSPMSLEQIGLAIKLSKERVRQIFIRAKIKSIRNFEVLRDSFSDED